MADEDKVGKSFVLAGIASSVIIQVELQQQPQLTRPLGKIGVASFNPSPSEFLCRQCEFYVMAVWGTVNRKYLGHHLCWIRLAVAQGAQNVTKSCKVQLFPAVSFRGS